MGKASKFRDCPALGREISVAECGGGRHSKIACTGECPCNPFALENYERMLEIEDRLTELTEDRLAVDPENGEALFFELEKARYTGPHAGNAFMTRRIFFDLDANGTTFAQRWERADWLGLKNDESVLMRGKMQMRVALLEVHRVLPGGWVEMVDLLAAQPETIRVRDNSFGKTAVRFTTILAWIYPTPHFWRINGSASDVPQIALLPAGEIVGEIVRHLGGPSGEAETRRWLVENFQRVDDAFRASILARRAQMLANIDANLVQAVYELQKTPAECRRRLDGVREVEPDDIADKDKDEGATGARVWLDSQAKPADVANMAGQVVLGRVLFCEKRRWRLEAMGAAKMTRLRELFEARMGDCVRFVSERRDNLGLRESLKEPTPDMTLVPPRLLEQPQKIIMQSSRIEAPPAGMSMRDYEQKLRQDAERAFLKDKIPALDNRTPIEAAADPTLRPRLVQMMKERVNAMDMANLKTGREDSIDWMLRELGLGEILFEAPPPREPLAGMDDDVDDDEDMDDDEFFADVDEAPDHNRNRKHNFGTRPPAPPLPAEPLDVDEASKRITAAMDSFETAAEAMNELDASGSTVLDVLADLTTDHLTDAERSVAAVIVLQTWFALVPSGCRAPEIDASALIRIFELKLSSFQSVKGRITPAQLTRIFAEEAQPALMAVLLDILINAAQPRGGKPLLTLPKILTIAAFIAALIDHLDSLLRRR